MPEYSDSPEIEAVVLQLRSEYQAALDAFEADPSEEHRQARDAAVEAFANARTTALNRTSVPVIGGDTVQEGVN
jgi:hypothetical protein